MATYTVETTKPQSNFFRLVMSRKFVAYTILLISYGMLIPGLTMHLYRYSFYGYLKYKGMIDAIQSLWAMGYVLASVLVTFFAILVPFIKLVMIVFAEIYKSKKLSRAAANVSKWAIADGIMASILLAYMCHTNDGTMEAWVEPGFAFFVSYCILSTVAALLLDECDEDKVDEQRKWTRFVLHPYFESRKIAGVLLVLSVVLSITGMVLPTVQVLYLKDSMYLSVFTAALRNLEHAQVGPFCVLTLFVVIAPLIEFVWLAVLLVKPHDNVVTRNALRVLPEAGLMDVYLVGVLVTYAFINTPSSLVHVYIPALGYVVFFFGVFFTYCTRYVLGRYLRKWRLARQLTVAKTTSMQRDVTDDLEMQTRC